MKQKYVKPESKTMVLKTRLMLVESDYSTDRMSSREQNSTNNRFDWDDEEE